MEELLRLFGWFSLLVRVCMSPSAGYTLHTHTPALFLNTNNDDSILSGYHRLLAIVHVSRETKRIKP